MKYFIGIVLALVYAAITYILAYIFDMSADDAAGWVALGGIAAIAADVITKELT